MSSSYPLIGRHYCTLHAPASASAAVLAAASVAAFAISKQKRLSYFPSSTLTQSASRNALHSAFHSVSMACIRSRVILDVILDLDTWSGCGVSTTVQQPTTMHPIASILQNINPEYDNIRFLARVVPQRSLPESHKFFNSRFTTPMLQYLPNRFAPDLKQCYDFLNGKFPSNCYHTNKISGEDLPDDIIDLHQGFEEIRPKGRYIIVAYILKKKTISVDEYCIYTGT
jgi:hypothetical protein